MSRLSDVASHLSYDPDAGTFTWKVARGRAKAGAIAGSLNKDGYVVIGRQYAHRLAFLIMTGSVPTLVDHRDRDKANNRWRNLRAATKAENAINTGVSARNASGQRGVSRHAASGKWQAHFGPTYLGIFVDKEDAANAYLAALQTNSTQGAGR